MRLPFPPWPAWCARWLAPSLTRRLLLAQTGLLLLLWCLVLGNLWYDMTHGESMLSPTPRYDMILTVADQLAEAPARQRHALAAIDRYLRTDNDTVTMPPWSLGMLVRRDGRIVYASAHVPPSLRGPVDGTVGRVEAAGVVWRVRTRRSAAGTELTLAQRSDSLEMMLEENTVAYLLLPLMFSLPLLAFPAWLSVRLALRPVRQVSGALADRGPHDLSPLEGVAPHRELQPALHALNDLLARLRAGVEREREFTANAAHELRTPLAALRVNIEALQAHAVAPAGRQLLAGTLNGVARATHLVEQLLALTRSDSVSGTRRRLALDQLVQDRMAAMTPLAAANKVELELELPAPGAAPVWIEGMQDSLVSVIDNLIDNAVKYSPAGATVTVQVWAHGGHALLAVRDRGPGIPAGLREQVFARFYRVPGQHTAGSGLGLAIVKAALVSHGGAIALEEPSDGAGLLARVTLPLASCR